MYRQELVTLSIRKSSKIILIVFPRLALINHIHSEWIDDVELGYLSDFITPSGSVRTPPHAVKNASYLFDYTRIKLAYYTSSNAGPESLLWYMGIGYENELGEWSSRSKISASPIIWISIANCLRFVEIFFSINT